MKKSRVLITGSEGVIGKILTKSLLSHFWVFRLDAIDGKGSNYFKVDISDLNKLDVVFQRIVRLDYIVHLAADSKVDASWESILKNNIIAIRNVYECARKYKVKKVIVASTNHVTGAYEGFPPRLHKQEKSRIITVRDPIRPDSYYAISKVFGEAIARQFFELYGVESICLRIGTVLQNDNPTKDKTKRSMKTWLSHRDLVQLVEKGMLSKIGFGIYYGVSNNKGRFWDISNAKKELGYKPKDDASLL